MFKIGNSKELPAIPDALSREGKDFVRCCLQRDPALRPTAAQLLEHPFVTHADTLAGADLLPNVPPAIRPVVSNSCNPFELIPTHCLRFVALHELVKAFTPSNADARFLSDCCHALNDLSHLLLFFFSFRVFQFVS